MALAQLKLRMELNEKKKTLAELRAKQDEFKRRADELDAAADEAGDDTEGLEAVKASIAELENEIAALGDLEGKIGELETDIADINAKIEEITTKSDEAAQNANTRNNKEVKSKMSKRTVFGALAPELRADYIGRTESKEFCQQIRAAMRGVTNGEINIPDFYLGLIADNGEKYSRLAPYMNERYVPGNGRIGIVGLAPEGVWTEACANLNELELGFSELYVSGYKIGGYIPLCNVLIDAADDALVDAVIEAILQAIGKGKDKAWIYGTGTAMPLGFVTRLAQQSQPSDWPAKGPTWTDLHSTNIQTLNISGQSGAAFFGALVAALGVADGTYSQSKEPVWIMNHKTHMDLNAKAMAYDSSAALVSRINNEMPVLGGKIVEFDLPDYEIAGGYLDLYLAVNRGAAKVEQSKDAMFIEDMTVFKGTEVADGKPIIAEGFVLVNYANTTPTTTALFAGDAANTKRVMLSTLAIGDTPLTLLPKAFDAKTTNYHTSFTGSGTTGTQKITATAANAGATVAIKVGDTSVTSGGNGTFSQGDNTVTVTVTSGTQTLVYTVIVNYAKV